MVLFNCCIVAFIIIVILLILANLIDKRNIEKINALWQYLSIKDDKIVLFCKSLKVIKNDLELVFDTETQEEEKEQILRSIHQFIVKILETQEDINNAKIEKK